MSRKIVSVVLCLLLLLPMLAPTTDSAAEKGITVYELAQLYYGDNEPKEWYTIEHKGFTEETPNYLKEAFLYGFIDDLSELDHTMTRSEAAQRISRSLVYALGDEVPTRDFGVIKPEDFHAVANVIEHSIIDVINGNFEPAKLFTRKQAEEGAERFRSNNIRGIFPLNGAGNDSHITVGTNYAYLDFESKDDATSYIEYHLDEITQGVKLSRSANQRVDIGFAILELWAPDAEIKFTFKSGITNIKFRQSKAMYGTFVYEGWNGEGYTAEARVLKPGEKPNMTVQPDTVHQKLYAKLDPIIKKIIKPNMTDVQKVKAIFDYVVTHIKYSKGVDFLSAENALEAINTGRGVCAHYTALFHYLAMRANIPTVPLQGDSFVGRHAWNMVYVNGKWSYLDATLADGKKTIDYTYYLKDANFMMNTREWDGFGYPDINTYPEVDGMKLKSTEEYRVFLLRTIENAGSRPKTIKFAVTNSNVDTNPKFLGILYNEANYKVTYDSKSKVYTLTRV
ncbi:transglutaminase domain-containing protein [Paenibacillus sp. GSMTC-2017]|uniref:transglutaminase domain-containing protein n=1 Tax=Paenibacillus sp. GSMTC-2017 TaxID=2794350 RepID=UPI0018D69EB1|nr:transglutaminase-like domain-containing protein [Paenibacillus sp. GSMTC-2017]MBH5318757.1 transglutaminase domain-containing protein [Paenibacillus sp. GSMTC-2017]